MRNGYMMPKKSNRIKRNSMYYNLLNILRMRFVLFVYKIFKIKINHKIQDNNIQETIQNNQNHLREYVPSAGISFIKNAYMDRLDLVNNVLTVEL